MASTGALVVTSVASGGFALAGAVVNNWTTARREERQLAADTALAVADGEACQSLTAAKARHTVAPEERRMPVHTVTEDPRRQRVRKIGEPRARAGSCSTRRRGSALATGR